VFALALELASLVKTRLKYVVVVHTVFKLILILTQIKLLC